MRILGIDPGLRTTGFGLIDTRGDAMRYVASGVIRSGEGQLPERLGRLHQGIIELVKEYRPTVAVCEIVFVNVNPKSTLLLGQARGAAIGARAVCVAPVRIGEWASVGAGAVVTRDVAPYALVVGVPARRVGWVGEAGLPLEASDDVGNEAGERTWVCPASGRRYAERDGALSPEEVQASSPNDAETPHQTSEDQQ